MDQFPPLVTRAQAAARQAGFPLTREEAGPGRPSACLPDIGRFLAVLVAGCAGGRIGELGTGAGIGAGWIASAMPADCVPITVEIDEPLACGPRAIRGGLASRGDHGRRLPPHSQPGALRPALRRQRGARPCRLCSAGQLAPHRRAHRHGRRNPRTRAPTGFAVAGRRHQAQLLH